MYQPRNSLPRSICISLIGLTVVVYTCSDIKYQPGDHRPARSPAVARQRSGKLNEPPNHQRLSVLRLEAAPCFCAGTAQLLTLDRKSTRLNSSHLVISYAVFCLKKKTAKP